MAAVYWIHLPEHNDITNQGYIGFTSKSVEVRTKQHYNSYNRQLYKHLPLYRALEKYEDQIVVSTLVEGSDEYCLSIENKLRPTEKIGWNIGTGGFCPSLGVTRSAETKQKLSEMRRRISKDVLARHGAPMQGKRHSDETKLRFSLARAKWKGSNTSEVWQHCVEIYKDYYTSNFRQIDIINKYSLTKRTVSNLLRHFKLGWNPNEDQEYLSWLKERKENNDNKTT